VSKSTKVLPLKLKPSARTALAQRRGPRRRRRPEDAESEILEAAEAFLRERPFHEMTVDELMARTGLSRPSFYEYFRDRHELIAKIVKRLQNMIEAMSERWFHSTVDPHTDLRRGFEGLIEVYREHGHLLRAVAAAAPQDRDVADAYDALINRITEGTARRIRGDIRKGRTRPLNVNETSRALIVMGERYLAQSMGREPAVAPRVAVDVLTTIWMRVLYDTPR
jgi:TetR/AcrR family transcriptional regulator, ethionamide resistance regulator